MRVTVKQYIACVAALAVASGWALWAVDRSSPSEHIAPVLFLIGLAAFAELLSFVLSGETTGSIAFIPYSAAALVVPHWGTLVAVALAKTVTQWKRQPVKGAFNVAQHVFTFATAALVFRLLGGTPLIELEHSTLPELTRIAGGQALVAFVAALFVNGLLVSGVIAVSSERRVVTVWREAVLATIGLDLLAGPLVFCYAWIYVKYGTLAAATLWVPILGFRQSQRATARLEQTNRELLELMVKSIEARDRYTSGHSRRVQHYAIIIARALGFREADVERLGQAALLHDIGKIHEKYAPILRKPGKLTPDEWRVMQEHPEDGAELVSTVSGLRDLVGPIRHHHESWDGTGYPDGLQGTAIPEYSRVIALADTIDAMTSERPYRKPLTADQVRAELVRCRGTQFDPDYCDKLVSSPIWLRLFAPSRATADRITGEYQLGHSERAELKRVM